MAQENKKQWIVIALIAIVITGGLFFKSKFMNDNKVKEVEIIQLTAAQRAEIKAPTEDEASQYDAQAENKTIVIETNKGVIKAKLYPKDAPYTVASFMKLVDKGFYNGLTFHRVIDGFMIQGGDPTGNGTGGPSYKFKDELNPATASYKEGYKKGVLAMANSGPNTNGSQFFIMVADYPLPNSYSIFGKVVAGQEVADAIAKVAKDRMDKPLSPVVIKRIFFE